MNTFSIALVALLRLANVLSLTANITKILLITPCFNVFIIAVPHRQLILRAQRSHDHSYFSRKYISSASLTE